jgi:hypothetical protein
MSGVLHLLTADTALAWATIAAQHEAGDQVTVVLLPGAPAVKLPPSLPVHRVPDDLSWAGLLDKIFAADQIVTW